MRNLDNGEIHTMGTARAAAAGTGSVRGVGAAPCGGTSEGSIQCPCGSNIDTGSTMIQCDGKGCGVWQHLECVIEADQSKPGADTAGPSATREVPPTFFCETCRLQRGDPDKPQQKADRTFSLTRPQLDSLQLPGCDLQVYSVQLSDKSPNRIHWPSHADLRVNGQIVKATSRPPQQLLGINGREDAASVLAMVPPEAAGESYDDALARVKRCVAGGLDKRGASGDGDSDSDLEVVQDVTVLSMRDPMSGARICTAGRFRGCQHMGGFDLRTLVEINQRARKWQCPVCLGSYTVEDLIVDPYFNCIAASLMGEFGEDVTDVEIRADGMWRPRPESGGRPTDCWREASAGDPGGGGVKRVRNGYGYGFGSSPPLDESWSKPPAIYGSTSSPPHPPAAAAIVDCSWPPGRGGGGEDISSNDRPPLLLTESASHEQQQQQQAAVSPVPQQQPMLGGGPAISAAAPAAAAAGRAEAPIELSDSDDDDDDLHLIPLPPSSAPTVAAGHHHHHHGGDERLLPLSLPRPGVVAPWATPYALDGHSPAAAVKASGFGEGQSNHTNNYNGTPFPLRAMNNGLSSSGRDATSAAAAAAAEPGHRGILMAQWPQQLLQQQQRLGGKVGSDPVVHTASTLLVLGAASGGDERDDSSSSSEGGTSLWRERSPFGRQRRYVESPEGDDD
eukprot:jgi/Mesen1/2536/ME000161S01598